MQPKAIGWVRFEGPGKLHVHRWHMAKTSPLNQLVTYCGMFVGRATVTELRGPGPVCGNCRRLADLPIGGYL